jgi:hypothetical protein
MISYIQNYGKKKHRRPVEVIRYVHKRLGRRNLRLAAHEEPIEEACRKKDYATGEAWCGRNNLVAVRNMLLRDLNFVQAFIHICQDIMLTRCLRTSSPPIDRIR